VKTLVIVLNHNGLGHIDKCLSSISASTECPHDVLVVDNNSTDGSLDYLKKEEEKGKIALLCKKTNLGFARGCNAGIRSGLGKYGYFVLLNPDVVIDSDNMWLSRMVHRAESEKSVGIVGAKILNTDRSIQSMGLIVQPSGDIQAVKLACGEIDYVSFACSLIKTEVFMEIGLLDESYFLYYEDSDFCTSAKMKGFDVVCEPSAEVIHNEGGLSKSVQKETFVTESRFVFMSKWGYLLKKRGLPECVDSGLLTREKNKYELFDRVVFEANSESQNGLLAVIPVEKRNTKINHVRGAVEIRVSDQRSWAGFLLKAEDMPDSGCYSLIVEAMALSGKAYMDLSFDNALIAGSYLSSEIAKYRFTLSGSILKKLSVCISTHVDVAVPSIVRIKRLTIYELTRAE